MAFTTFLVNMWNGTVRDEDSDDSHHHMRKYGSFFELLSRYSFVCLCIREWCQMIIKEQCVDGYSTS